MVNTGESDQVWERSNAQRTRLSYVLRCVGALLLGGFSLLGALTVMTVADASSGGPEAFATGTARVGQCMERGPVSVSGLGYFHRCQADVTWNDGSSSREWFPAGQLSPDDRGRAVPVFDPKLPESGVGRGSPISSKPGVNDSAKWVTIGIIGATALGAFGVFALLAALVNAYWVVLPGRRAFGVVSPARGVWQTMNENAGRELGQYDRAKKGWPVTDADVAAVPVFRRQKRMRLLSALSGGVIVLHLLTSIPRTDAPRAIDFVSPWPEIARAWLVGPDGTNLTPHFGVAVVGAGIAVLLWWMPSQMRVSSARVVTYGMPFLVKQGNRTRKQGKEELRRMAEGRQSAYRRGVAFAVVILAFAVYAAIHAFGQLPSGAPIAVVLAGLRDAIALTSVGLILLATVEPKYDRLSRLLAIHEEHAAISGTHGTNTGGAKS